MARLTITATKVLKNKKKKPFSPQYGTKMGENWAKSPKYKKNKNG